MTNREMLAAALADHFPVAQLNADRVTYECAGKGCRFTASLHAEFVAHQLSAAENPPEVEEYREVKRRLALLSALEAAVGDAIDAAEEEQYALTPQVPEARRREVADQARADYRGRRDSALAAVRAYVDAEQGRAHVTKGQTDD